MPPGAIGVRRRSLMADQYDLAEQLLGPAVDDGPATDAVRGRAAVRHVGSR